MGKKESPIFVKSGIPFFQLVVKIVEIKQRDEALSQIRFTNSVATNRRLVK
ncbi:hypothetical protein BH09BAC4_BH09BAC4_25420 [soil metagenome]